MLFVGRLNEQKNLFALIEGCKLADQKLYLIGDGELRDELENHAKELKADIEFLGRIPNQDLPHYLNSFSIFTLPSFYEGNPKTFLEAPSSGACCLVANSPGIKEIVSHKENAYLVETSASSIAEGLKVLAQDKKLRQEMGERARSFALANCTLDSLVRFEAQIYKELLGPRI